MTDETPDPEPATPPPTPPAPPRGHRPWLTVLVGLAGLAVGAVTVGAAWLVTGVGVVDRRPITAPRQIGSYVPVTQAMAGSSTFPDTLARIQERNKRSSELLSQSHGGAGALVELYSDLDIRHQLTVMIYRAESPHPLYAPYEDDSSNGLAKPTLTIEEYGQVSCVVRNDATPAGRPPGPNSAHAVECARTNALLTVDIQPQGTTADAPDRIAALVDKAWSLIV